MFLEIFIEQNMPTVDVKSHRLGGYTLHGHKLRFLSSGEAQFVTWGIIYACMLHCEDILATVDSSLVLVSHIVPEQSAFQRSRRGGN